MCAMGWVYYSDPERDDDEDRAAPLWAEKRSMAAEPSGMHRPVTAREGRDQIVLPGFEHLVVANAKSQLTSGDSRN